MSRKLWLAAGMLAVISLTQGCLYWGDSTKVVQPTVGQQLSDLKSAHDKGVINDQQYEEQKVAILKDGPATPSGGAKSSVTTAAYGKPGVKR